MHNRNSSYFSSINCIDKLSITKFKLSKVFYCCIIFAIYYFCSANSEWWDYDCEISSIKLLWCVFFLFTFLSSCWRTDMTCENVLSPILSRLKISWFKYFFHCACFSFYFNNIFNFFCFPSLIKVWWSEVNLIVVSRTSVVKRT